MKYITLKKIPRLNVKKFFWWNPFTWNEKDLVQEVGDIVDIHDETGGEEIEKAVSEGVLELCVDQSIKNKHFVAFMKPQDVKLQVLKNN